MTLIVDLDLNSVHVVQNVLSKLKRKLEMRGKA